MLATTIHKSNTTPHHQDGATTTHPHRGQHHPRFPQRGQEVTGLLSQSPIVCPMAASLTADVGCRAPDPHPLQVRAIIDSPRSRLIRAMRAGLSLEVLLRKEVIQPHLPVRLPCYDFVPIADPTFDGSPPYGLGHRLRVLPTFMT
jgi:hypothetical protein